MENLEKKQKKLDMEEQLSYVRLQRKELREAKEAGLRALDIAHSMEGELRSAHGWGIFDIIGGGLISTLIKHSHMDNAQGQVGQLQQELNRFRTELADIHIDGNLQLGMDGFMTFADYIFDGLIFDWVALDRINKSEEQVGRVINQVELTLSRLDHIDEELAAKEEQIKEGIEGINDAD